ncbi:hypothetical protein SCAR479_13945 [Seiridium cardinale]|uniref:Uncharacterized protein n=1 Tax=Seiridium cardinale TaxID=138064 RepID=A0ABR2X6M3_9PEZI
MAANIPAKLKQAGITPFVVRGNQLRTAKPVISYWCDYWVVNQILAKQLHNADEECLHFTTAMMDQLEEMKANNQGNTAILNDDEGRAYVEQFAQETIDRAMRPLKANKVTQQTAVTFEAAATFLQLLNIWGTLDVETEKKIKFAKWNAARILRAIKEGKDPNESNPKIEEEEKVDEDDPELQAIMAGQAPKAATVEDAPDEEGKGYLDPNAAAAASSAYSPGPVSAPTSPPQGSAPVPEQVSPIAPTDRSAPDGYFPNAPAAADDDPPLELPSAPATLGDPEVSIPSPPTDLPSARDAAGQPSAPLSPPTFPDTPQDFYRPTPSDLSSPFQPPQPPAPSQPPPPSSYHQQPSAPQAPSQPPPWQPPSVPTFAAPTSQAMPAAQTPQPVPPVSQYGRGPPTNAAYQADDMAMMQAQKHAKWAISALNFEDVSTAVRELKSALAVLGAQ